MRSLASFYILRFSSSTSYSISFSLLHPLSSHFHPFSPLLTLLFPSISLIPLFPTPFISGNWPPYASYLTLETARLTIPSPRGGAVLKGIVGEMYVRAVYNDKDLVMEGCGGEMWCPYELFRTQILKWSITHSAYIKECRNT